MFCIFLLNFAYIDRSSSAKVYFAQFTLQGSDRSSQLHGHFDMVVEELLIIKAVMATANHSETLEMWPPNPPMTINCYGISWAIWYAKL